MPSLSLCVVSKTRVSALRFCATGIVLSLTLALAACGGGGGGSSSGGNAPAAGKDIDTPAFETYTTDHNGYSRVRLQTATDARDNAILGQFDDANPDSPSGYRNLIAQTEARFVKNMTIEVIAEVSGSGDDEKIERILRLTADQAPFDNVDRDGNLIASGQYYFRGGAEVYASVDGGSLQRGVGDLENMIVDFDSETVTINIRTPYDPAAGSEIETAIQASNLPLNVLTGAFGGTIEMTSRSADTGQLLSSTGQLRGNLNGDEKGLSRLVENMTTSGLFTAGSDGDRLRADGVFWGSQLNYED